MTGTPEDWVLIEAAKRCGWADTLTITYLQRCYGQAPSPYRALCDMIAKHEQKPVDRRSPRRKGRAMSDRTKAMDSLIAQDADLIDVPSRVTEADHELLIRLSNPDDETAQRIRRGLIYTWEARQIANHREQAAAEERAKIVAWLRDSKSVMKIMEPWHSRKKDGTLTNKTRENIGVAYIAMKDAADAIEAKEHLK